MDNRIEVCNQIIEDINSDINKLDGSPFNGKVVATQFGNQAACIEALAKIMKTILKELKEDQK